MATTDSGDREKVVGMLRNRWSPSTGWGGRHAPDSVAVYLRATQYDWYRDIAPAIRHPATPWLSNGIGTGLPLPPWAAVILTPLGLFPDRLGSTLVTALFILSIVLFLGHYHGPWWALFPIVLSLPGVGEITTGQTEFLILLGLILPANWGLPLYILKPQASIGVIIPHFRRYGWRLFFPSLAVLLASLLVWGLWPFAIYSRYNEVLINGRWNVSLFPWTVPVGLYLLYNAWKSKYDLLGIIASPLLFPYINYISLTITLSAIFVKWGRKWWVWLIWIDMFPFLLYSRIR